MVAVGAFLVVLGLAVAALNVVTVLRNHAALRSRTAPLFLAAGLLLFSSLLVLRRTYPGWRLVLGVFAVIVVAEALPPLLEAVLASGVRKRAERLEGADLEAENLQGRNLRGARLRGANLRRADLRGADLRDADLTEADLTNADLGGAFLVGATLVGARFAGADLRDTQIQRVDGFEKARYSHETRWPDEMDPSQRPG